jgi:hypothetical protein
MATHNSKAMNQEKAKLNRDEFALQKLMGAFAEFNEGKAPTIRCEQCGGAIEFHLLGTSAWKSSCLCGKYGDILRGV